MTRISCITAVAAGLLLLSVGTIERAAAEPVEIKVLASVALTSALDELAPQFERATGNKLTLGYSLIADLKKRILAGEAADLIILSRPAMDDLQKADKIASGSIADIVGTPVAVAVKAGAPKPDISSVDALKRSLLAAKSIVYADPAKGGASGVYFARVVDQLGLTEQLKSKTILVPGAQAAEVLAKGEAEIGIAQASEIVPDPGAQLVGPCRENSTA
jgi:molybdate transport system substrate-binding protein